jgi:aryl-alcohol dehydrogenase-like predicted oxidoreductase
MATVTSSLSIERSEHRNVVPMAKALNLGLTAWSPLAKGILTGKYHGHGSSEQGRMNSEAVRPNRRSRQSGIGSDRPRHGASRAGMAPLPPGAGHPHYRGTKAFSAAG